MAPSIWRRLLMQALVCEVVRALTKLGIAMAANKPMMATTIMISTRVKPDLREVFTFMLTYLSVLRGVNKAAGGLVLVRFRSLIACCNREKIRANLVPAKSQGWTDRVQRERAWKRIPGPFAWLG